jgi:hypothetical protein
MRRKKDAQGPASLTTAALGCFGQNRSKQPTITKTKMGNSKLVPMIILGSVVPHANAT